MITIRKAAQRGRTNIDWLDSWHSFSFGDYYDPRNMGFGPLRVINDDIVGAGGGFGMHPHRDMEIITYVVSGSLEHKDSLGTGSVIKRGEVQRMTAGTGIRHSEFNPSPSEAVRLLQIWIMPDRQGLKPSYEQRTIGDDQKQNRLRLIASHDGRDGAVTINQDADVYAALLQPGQKISHPLRTGRSAWAQVVSGNLTLNGAELSPGDGAAIQNESNLEFLAGQPAELLLFDLGPAR
jgi:redox-sensitive bicupin YhaK (pirin superfamily)